MNDINEINDTDTNEENSNGRCRVKDVSEINSEYTSPKKRKLPNWLSATQDQNLSDNKRKQKEVVSCSTKNSIFNLGAENVDKNKSSDELNKFSGSSERDSSMGKLEISNKISLTDNNSTTNDDIIGTNVHISHISEYKNLYSVSDINTTDEAQETKSILIVEFPFPINVEVKKEKEKSVGSTVECSTSDIIRNIKQSVKEKPSSTTRESCKYGIRCYRRNPQHRIEEAHPGDTDYSRPNYPEPSKGTPACSFGDLCYRRNPGHFQDFSHPHQLI